MGFTVSPLLVELEGAPGSTLGFEVSVMNESATRPGNFTVSVVPIRQDLSGNYRVDPAGQSERSAVPWIRVSPDRFSLEPGKGQLITGELTFPRQFRGGAYAAVLVTLHPEEGGEPDAARQVLRNEVAVIVEAVAATPGIRPDIHFERFSVVSAAQEGLEEYARQFGSQALIFAGDVINEGTVHGFASGAISLWDEAGRKIKQIPLGAGRAAILPAATVRLASILPNGLPPGHYSLQAVVNYGGLRPAILRQKFTVGAELLQASQTGREVRVAVEPDEVTLGLVPGAARFSSLRIRNLDKVPLVVSARVLPLVYDASGSPNTEPVVTSDPAVQWARLRPDTVTVEPGQVRSIQVGVQAPKDAPKGGHYAQVLLTARPAQQSGGEVAETELNVPLHAMLGEDLQASAELAPLRVEPSADGRFWLISSVFRNTGQVHLAPSAQVFVELKTIPETAPGTEYAGDPLWVEAARLTLPPVTTPVLPGGERNLGALIEIPSQPGEYRLRAIVRYGSGPALTQEAMVQVSEASRAGQPATQGR